MTRAISITSYALISLSGVLFLAGLVPDRGTRGGIAINQSHLRGVHATPGQRLELSFEITNHGMSDLWIVGAEEECFKGGCVDIQGLPLTIPVGERRSVVVKFRAGRPGEFAHEFPIYTSHPIEQTITLAVKGIIDPDSESRPTPDQPE